MPMRFEAHGDLPPKKAGAQSVWGKLAEARRIEKLRRAAQGALARKMPFEARIRHWSLACVSCVRQDELSMDTIMFMVPDREECPAKGNLRRQTDQSSGPNRNG